jgi:hypothetical protein
MCILWIVIFSGDDIKFFVQLSTVTIYKLAIVLAREPDGSRGLARRCLAEYKKD